MVDGVAPMNWKRYASKGAGTICLACGTLRALPLYCEDCGLAAYCGHQCRQSALASHQGAPLTSTAGSGLEAVLLLVLYGATTVMSSHESIISTKLAHAYCCLVVLLALPQPLFAILRVVVMFVQAPAEWLGRRKAGCRTTARPKCLRV
jgi:hypothetical protein